MTVSRFLLLGCSILSLTSCDQGQITSSWDNLKTWVQDNIMPHDSHDISVYLPQELIRPEQTVTGSYLASRFAQNNGDWNAANKFVNDILDESPDNVDFQRKSMILAMGSGRYADAMNAAKKLVALNDQGSLAYILLTLESFKDGNADKTLAQARGIPQDGISEFITPLITGWANAMKKETNISGLNRNPVHLYHAILIADYLNDRASLIPLAKNDFVGMGLSNDLLKKLEDIFTSHDLKSDARRIHDKLAQFKNDNSLQPLTLTPITSPREGLAQALFDMGSMLYSSYGDSARLFAHMALYLNPSHIDSKILLAQMSSEMGRVDDAISLYQKIDTAGKPDLDIKIQRQIAELLEKSGKDEAAIRVLKQLVSQTKNIDAQIQIGDIYRYHEKFDQALKEYNTAATMIGEPIPKQYWQLLYARGIVLERLKKWDKAEADLKAALAFEPDHPYILNYLAYSWADQGLHLNQAVDMIKRAIKILPTDGYIVDSLGWVYYRMKDYPRAVKYLEQAVALMPNDPTINDHLGDAYWKIGRKNEAIFQWKRALSLNPDAEQMESIPQKIENGLIEPEAKLMPIIPLTTSSNQ
jgi:tetratricopeptide (TPR) repeat protein